MYSKFTYRHCETSRSSVPVAHSVSLTPTHTSPLYTTLRQPLRHPAPPYATLPYASICTLRVPYLRLPTPRPRLPARPPPRPPTSASTCISPSVGFGETNNNASTSSTGHHTSITCACSCVLLSLVNRHPWCGQYPKGTAACIRSGRAQTSVQLVQELLSFPHFRSPSACASTISRRCFN